MAFDEERVEENVCFLFFLTYTLSLNFPPRNFPCQHDHGDMFLSGENIFGQKRKVFLKKKKTSFKINLQEKQLKKV